MEAAGKSDVGRSGWYNICDTYIPYRLGQAQNAAVRGGRPREIYKHDELLHNYCKERRSTGPLQRILGMYA